MQWFESWLTGILGAALLSAMALALTPEGSVKKVTRLVCGVGVMAALLAVGMEFDIEGYALHLRRYREKAEELAATGEEQMRKETRVGIEEELGAYICHKGEELGLTLQAEVIAKWDREGYWIPYSVRITGDAEASARERLGNTITSDLGIPRERQWWEGSNEEEAPRER